MMNVETLFMAYVIVDTCTKDEHCIEACPVNCIHPTKDEPAFETVSQLYVQPDECIDCGACVPVCPTNSMFLLEEVPAEHADAIAKNAAYFA
jgi:NAD-dependent dihydropyrimidine dehydrogenase PreA subunit